MIGVLSQLFFDQKATALEFMLMEGQTMKHYMSEGVWMELFSVFLFALIYLQMSGPTTSISRDQGMQTLVIGVAYGTIVAYSRDVSGGCINIAFALAMDFWHSIDTENGYTWRFFPLYVACGIIGSLVAVLVHWIIGMKAHDSARPLENEIISAKL